MKRFYCLIVGLLCLIIAAGCTSSNSESTSTPTASNSKSTTTPSAASTPNKSVERMLAEIETRPLAKVG